MRKNNNKGSSLILAIVLFAVLLTVGGAALTIINTNYKVRVKEGKRLQNLYESDAGLDVAYNILVKTFEAGIKSGSDSVGSIDPTKLEDAETTKDKVNIINEEFKKGFTDIVTKDEIIKSIESNKYIKNYKENNEDKKYQVVEFNSSNEEYPKLTCNVNENDDEYTVTVLSEFKSNKVKSSVGENLRQIQVVYELKVPDYENAVEVEMDSKISNVKELVDKIIGIDGNMNVSGNVNLNIEGDVFVKGEKEADPGYSSKIYEKYSGGITLNNKSNENTEVILKGNIMTPKTFNVGNKTGIINTTINGNIYVGNVYIGNKDGSYAQNNTTTINGELIVDNDLAMKGNNTSLTIKDFYGINDKTYESDYSKSDDRFETEKRVSSSIIVNGGSGSINIKNSAYIMGTAYIDAQKNGESYKTGESLAVKGNYIAYTKKQDSINGYDFENYDFDLYGPLQLIDSIDGKELNIDQKSMYFKEFVNTSNRTENISDGGVILPKNTKAVGAILYKDENGIKAERNTYTLDSNSPIYDKRRDYTKNVYCMGTLDGTQDYESIYNRLGGYQKTVNEILGFTGKEELEGKVTSDFVLNYNPSKTIYITDNPEAFDSKVRSNNIVINAKDPKNMMILTNGNVEIIVKENIKYNGNIVSTKNIDIRGNGNITMKYDEKVINRLISKYSNDLKDIFNSKLGYDLQQTINTIPVYYHQYDIKKYIQSKDWKIVR